MTHKWPDNLVKWYNKNKRTMPWRGDVPSYYTWISEAMLQQTQVDTVIPYFNRFIEAFPTVEALANADLQHVLKLWEGLGYYSRARNLHKAANIIVNEFNGSLPKSYQSLQTLPGIGPYIAAAITSIAFNNPVPVVDGNVLRVFTRFWEIEDDIRLPAVRNTIFDRLTPFIETQPPSEFNQAIMELGALICTPKSPKCTICPVQENCQAFNQNRTTELPYKSKKQATPHHDIAVGIIWRNNKLLIGKRKETQMLGGLWEFPGGKQEPGETLQTTVAREIKEETGLTVDVGSPYCKVKHAFTHFKITITAFKCHVVSGRTRALSADELKWISIDDLDQYPFPTANKKIIQAIRDTEAFELN